MIDYETGNITHVTFETYEEMKEDYENQIQKMQYENEDLRDEVDYLKSKLEKALAVIKKDSIAATNESK